MKDWPSMHHRYISNFEHNWEKNFHFLARWLPSESCPILRPLLPQLLHKSLWFFSESHGCQANPTSFHGLLLAGKVTTTRCGYCVTWDVVTIVNTYRLSSFQIQVQEPIISVIAISNITKQIYVSWRLPWVQSGSRRESGPIINVPSRILGVPSA